jgi:hypothetical protein
VGISKLDLHAKLLFRIFCSHGMRAGTLGGKLTIILFYPLTRTLHTWVGKKEKVKDVLSCDNESLLRKLQTVISEVQVNWIVAFIEKLQMLILLCKTQKLSWAHFKPQGSRTLTMRSLPAWITRFHLGNNQWDTPQWEWLETKRSP